MKKILTFLFLIGTCFSQTVNSNFYPAQTGLSLGRNGQRWSIFAKNLDVAGSITVNGAAGHFTILPVFGSGQYATSTDLLTTTPGQCAVWLAGNTLGTIACALASNTVSEVPTASQTITQPPGTSINFVGDVVIPERSKGFINAITDCAVPTDTVTDAFPALKACVNAHPGSHIRLLKVRTSPGCDYMLSDSIWALGQGQWIDGQAAGPGNGAIQTTVCTSKPGVTPFVGTNNHQGARWSNLEIIGSEQWSRSDIATFKLPLGFGYPGVEWITGTASAASTTLTVNGTNEAWTAQTDAQTVRVYGAGATQGTVSMTTSVGSYLATCTCTPSMVGETIAIPGAGTAGATLYAHITGIAGTFPFSTGNAQMDHPAAVAVTGVSSVLALDYYGTISSHASAASATVTPAISTAVTNSIVLVGSDADGIRSSGVGNRIDHVAVFNMGRHAYNVANTSIGTGSGGASTLADQTMVDSVLAIGNRGSGVYCQGADCNVSKFSNSTLNQNQLWGVNDTGFLVNTIDTVNTAGNHVDCTTTPCPAVGGSTTLKNINATWSAGLPYASAPASPFYVTDGTCTNASTTVTTTATGKFKTGHAGATNGQIIKLTNCGTGGSTDLVTFITGYTSANSVTVADAPSCGGSCPTPGAVTLQVYSTVTITGTPFFDPTFLGHTILLDHAAAGGQALLTTPAIYYSTTKVGLNAAPAFGSIPQAKTIYFGASDYAGQKLWDGAWTFSTGAVTAAASVLTTTAANDLLSTNFCNAAVSLRPGTVTIVGAGPGGTDHVTTCSVFTNTHQVTIASPAYTTVTDAQVRVSTDGGPFKFRGGTCLNCYAEIDQFLNASKFGPGVWQTPSVGNVPATAPALNTYSPISGNAVAMTGTTFHNFADGGLTMNFAAGRTTQQQIDLNWISTTDFTTKMAQISMTSNNVWQFIVGQQAALTFSPGAVRDYFADTAITSGIAHRFKGNAGLQQLFAINADGSLLFSCSSGSINCGKFISTNTATRTYTLPDATGTVLVTGNGITPLQTKRVAGCATAASLAATCTTTLTWTTAFADTNYTVNCIGSLITSGVPLNGGLTAKSASAIDFQTVSATAAAAQYTNIGCTAIHD